MKVVVKSSGYENSPNKLTHYNKLLCLEKIIKTSFIVIN